MDFEVWNAMYGKMTEICPSLGPSLLFKGYDHQQLRYFCKDEKESKKFEVAYSKARDALEACSVCQGPLTDPELSCTWTFDPAHTKCNLNTVQVCLPLMFEFYPSSYSNFIS